MLDLVTAVFFLALMLRLDAGLTAIVVACLAFELAAEADLGRLVSATYPLRRFRDAIEHAATAGARGAVKVAFDLRDEKERVQ